MGSFLKIRSRKDPASSTPAATGASPPKKEIPPLPMTPLEKMLQDSSAIREDGSDKFFGMENYGNTCYCNSILQCLYYSVPFREAVINYPTRTPIESLQAALAGNLRFQDAIANMEAEAQAEKQKAANAQRPGASPAQPQKPEDKDSPEYKKKMALQTMPILETKNNATSYGMSESLFTSLKDIFESVVGSQSRIGIIKPQHFLDILRRENEMFRSAMHQDAHEFLNLLLNEVVANVETEASKQPLADRNLLPPTESVDSIDHSGSSGSKTPNTTRWVHELFEGTLTSETQCLTCEKVSQRDEIFLDLSVDLEQHSSVTSCLRKFSAEEMLCERNKFHCDNCGGLQEAEKRMKIKRLPRILALHLKRFKYTEDLQRLQKLFHRVVYPYHLRLFNTTDDAEDPDRLYELYAVVVHIGGGPYHGHYVAIIKTQDRGWLLFDDEMVEPVDKNFVRNFFGDKPGLACAYVLFYQETTLEAVLKEQEMENMQAAAGATATDSTKQNGFPQSPGLAHVHSESAIPSQDESVRRPGLSRAPSAPPLSTHPEHVELEKEKSSIKSPTRFSSSTAAPPVPPIPESHTFTLGTKKSDLQTKKERAKEEKERRIAEKEREKQRRKEHEARTREQEAKAREDQRREEAELKAAMEESRLSKVEEDRRNHDHGKPGGLSRLKRGVSHRLGTHKENQRSSTTGTVIGENHTSSPSNGIPEPSPPLPKSPAAPNEPHRSKLQSKKHTSHEEDRDGLKNNKDLKHAPRSHGKWRSFSLRKKSFSTLT